jgi:hypothetical protein
MRCLVTLVLLALSIYVILYFPESDKKWAFASLGTIAGYWLSKSEK